MKIVYPALFSIENYILCTKIGNYILYAKIVKVLLKLDAKNGENIVKYQNLLQFCNNICQR